MPSIRTEVLSVAFLDVGQGALGQYNTDDGDQVYYRSEACVAMRLEEDEYLLTHCMSSERRTRSLNPCTASTAMCFQQETLQEMAGQALGGQPEDFMVLLHIGPNSNTRFSFTWWGGGTMYFVMRKDDPVKRDFSRVYMDIER